jgi:hypothetical protein
MSNAGKLVQVMDSNLSEFMAAEWTILILTKTDCGACATFQAQIETLLEQGKLAGITLGKMVLNQPGLTNFKRTNPWLIDIHFLPYTLLYHKGQQLDNFAASKGSYLLERIEDAQVMA